MPVRKDLTAAWFFCSLSLVYGLEHVRYTGQRSPLPCWGSIDDRVVAEALKAAVSGYMPEDARAQSLKPKLEAMREFRCDVSDDVCRDGLRTILQSVHRHSGLERGEREYLDFASEFIL